MSSKRPYHYMGGDYSKEGMENIGFIIFGGTMIMGIGFIIDGIIHSYPFGIGSGAVLVLFGLPVVIMLSIERVKEYRQDKKKKKRLANRRRNA